MANPDAYGLSKAERIHSRLVVNQLFSSSNSSIAIYPLRTVWMISERTTESPVPSVSFLVSVPKKRFHHAVDRNRVKRQVREAFRLNKHILNEKLQDDTRHIDIAFICIADHLHDSRLVHKSVVKSLMRIADSL